MHIKPPFRVKSQLHTNSLRNALYPDHFPEKLAMTLQSEPKYERSWMFDHRPVILIEAFYTSWSHHISKYIDGKNQYGAWITYISQAPGSTYLVLNSEWTLRKWVPVLCDYGP